MYTGDYDGYIWGYDAGSSEHWWPIALLPYYGEQDLCLCPAATKLWSDDNFPTSISAWGIWTEEEVDLPDDMMEGYEGLYGSYGVNEWIGNQPEGWERIEGANWRRASVKGAGTIPMIMDCAWAGGFPEHTHRPPAYEGEMGLDQPEMRRYVINRHDYTVNCCFVDGSVRNLGLKQLWTVKWHRHFATNGPYTAAGGMERSDWLNEAPWMAYLRDY